MMRFRYIDIPKLVYELLRGNMALRRDYDEQTQPELINNLYRVCLALVWCLNEDLRAYYRMRCKWYMLAHCTPTYGQIERVLNYWYGDFGPIYVHPSEASVYNSYWYAEADPSRLLYWGEYPQVFLGRGGNYTEAPIVEIPAALQANSEVYEQFIADLNILTPFFVDYTIQVTDDE